MTPDRAATVRRTFRLVETIQEQVSVLFYRRLVSLDPEIAVLVQGRGTDRQREDLIQALAGAVDRLAEPISAEPGDVRLVLSPAIPGLAPEGLEVAGTALIWALGQALGTGFTMEVETAWRAALDVPAGPALAPSEPAVRRPRRLAASSSRASDTPRSTPPVPPA